MDTCVCAHRKARIRTHAGAPIRADPIGAAPISDYQRCRRSGWEFAETLVTGGTNGPYTGQLPLPWCAMRHAAQYSSTRILIVQSVIEYQ